MPPYNVKLVDDATQIRHCEVHWKKLDLEARAAFPFGHAVMLFQPNRLVEIAAECRRMLSNSTPGSLVETKPRDRGGS